MGLFGFTLISNAKLESYKEKAKKADHFAGVIEDLNHNMVIVTDRVRRRDSEIELKNKELLEVGKDLSSCKKEISELVKSRNKYIASLKEKTDEINSINEQLVIANSNSEAYIKKIESNKKDLGAKNKEIRTLKDLVYDKDQQIFSLQSELEALKNKDNGSEVGNDLDNTAEIPEQETTATDSNDVDNNPEVQVQEAEEEGQVVVQTPEINTGGRKKKKRRK